MRETLNELLGIAKHAARIAAAIHRNIKQDSLAVRTKSSPIDLVTEVDREAERQMVAIIHSARPDDAIVGEEGTNITGNSGVCWVIDPLDGTTNFIHKYPAYAASVGVEINKRRVLGVVHDSFNDIVYEGIVDAGARCEGKPITASTEAKLSQALIGTGFLPAAEVRRMQAMVLGNMLPLVRDIRRSGCPSLDLCAVASGMLDGFYESGLGHWDIAAGAAIAEAAGAKVIELSTLTLLNPLVVVTNRRLKDELIAALVKSGGGVY